MTNLSQLNSFLSLVISELNKSMSYTQDDRKWFINHYILGNECRSEITLGEGRFAETVASIKTGVLNGNDIKPDYVDMHKIFADGLIHLAEKKSLI